MSGDRVPWIWAALFAALFITAAILIGSVTPEARGEAAPTAGTGVDADTVFLLAQSPTAPPVPA